MAVKAIKQRIKSVKNTAQITKAMEVVSATKMRRSQECALRARPYAVAALEMLKNVLLRTSVLPPLLRERPVRTSALLVVTSDKGLAGAFNANVLRKAEELIYESRRAGGKNVALVTVGKKARDYFERRGVTIERSFWGFGDYRTPQQTLPAAEHILNGFLRGRWDEVYAVYANFRTTLIQETVVRKIMPATKEGLEEAVKEILPERGRYAELETRNDESGIRYNYEYTFEPSPEEILATLVPRLIRVHVHHIILESNASEHSARMVAMKNASDNASELISDLTLEYNKSRQAEITQELAEITAGAEALER